MQKAAIGRNGKKRWSGPERVSGHIKKRISGGCSVRWISVSDTGPCGGKRDDK